MQVQARVVNPDEVLVAMTIEMPLRSWKAIRQVLAHSTWQRSDTDSVVGKIIESLDEATTRIENAITLKTEETT